KASPGKYSYGHSGIGNATHVAAELFQTLAGIELLKVPYRGTSSFAPDIMSGHVDVGFMSTVLATPNVGSGLLRALAISGRQRAPSLPDVPTLQELGYGCDWIFRPLVPGRNGGRSHRADQPRGDQGARERAGPEGDRRQRAARGRFEPRGVCA